MIDILLDKDGDISITPSGDITLTESVMQAVKVRLRWILNEWRFAPEYGFPWFEDMLVKKPDFDKLKSIIRSEVLSVDGVKSCEVNRVTFDKDNRKATFEYQFSVDDETYMEEMEVNV